MLLSTGRASFKPDAHGDYMADLLDGWVVDAEEEGGLGRYINHHHDDHVVTHRFCLAYIQPLSTVRPVLMRMRLTEPGELYATQYCWALSDSPKVCCYFACSS